MTNKHVSIHYAWLALFSLLAVLGAMCDLPTQSGVNQTIDEVCTQEIEKVLNLVDDIKEECNIRAEEAEAQCRQSIEDVKDWIESEAENQLMSMGCTKTPDTELWDCSLSDICDDDENP